MIGSLIIWIVLAPIFGLFVHECAHGVVVARYTGRRTAVRIGRGPRLLGLRLWRLDIELRLVAIHGSCSVDLTGLPVYVARSALRAGPLVDFGQAVLWLMAVGLFPKSVWTCVGVAMQYTWWGVTSRASRSGMRFGEPYESDGFKLRALDERVEGRVVTAPTSEDPLLAYLKTEAPQLLGGAAPAPASAPAPTAVQVAAAPTAPAAPVAPAPAPADPLLAYLQETAPELVATVTDERPPARPSVDPRAATSIAPPGMR